MDKENLSKFLDNTIRTCKEQAQNKGMSEEEAQRTLNESLMQFYKILAGYTNGTVDNETHQLFVQKCPEFGRYLQEIEQQEKARIDGLNKEKEQLQRRLLEIDSELRNLNTVKGKTNREPQGDPCSR